MKLYLDMNVYMESSKAKAKDSLHLACAIHSDCDCFITCDDRLI